MTNTQLYTGSGYQIVLFMAPVNQAHHLSKVQLSLTDEHYYFAHLATKKHNNDPFILMIIIVLLSHQCEASRY
jgi:hypothetical protein